MKMTMRVLIGIAVVSFICLAVPQFFKSLQNAGPVGAVENFYYDSWDVQYFVDTNEEGMAVAEVTETISPVFPMYDQNRGIVRSLPLLYEGSELGMSNVTVTDLDGNPYPFFMTTNSESAPVINVGNDDFLQGPQNFVIKYTINDVISKNDQFYWNMVDSARAQAIDKFTSTVTFSDSLAPYLTEEFDCFVGGFGSTQKCEYETTPNSITSLPTNLGAKESLTFQVGLEEGSVVQPEARASYEDNSIFLAKIYAPFLILLIAAITYDLILRRRNKIDMTVIPEYETDLSPFEIAFLSKVRNKKTRGVGAASIMNLVVNGAVEIEEMSSVSVNLQVKDRSKVAKLPKIDQWVFEKIFPEGNNSFNLRNISSFVDSANNMAKRAIMEEGVVVKKTILPVQLLTGLATVVGLIAYISLISKYGSETSITFPVFCGFVYLLLLPVIAEMCGKSSFLTPKGKKMAAQIEGLKMFIKISEEDRLNALQSASTAELTDRGIYIIYEKMLPYAILFKLEKSWAEKLKIMPESEYTPAVSSTTNLLTLISVINTASVPVQTYSSSSSGSSYSAPSFGGGGFSGGGGGGGFSGGR